MIEYDPNDEGVELTSLEFDKYGITVPVRVTAEGRFQAKLNDEGFVAETLAELRSELHAHIYSSREDVPFVDVASGWRGVIRGVHQGRKVLLVTWEDGSKGNIDTYTKVAPATTPDEVLVEIKAANDALVAAQVRVKQSRDVEGATNADDFFGEAIGHNLLGWDRKKVAQALEAEEALA